MKKSTKEIARFHADANHDVVTVDGESGHMTSPCAECPWRVDSPLGAFPPDAYRHSARTAHDMSTHQFGCHMSGTDKPKTCAGFLMKGAAHNMGVRMTLITGQIDFDKLSSDVELYEDYRAMAEANGVPADDPALWNCR